jgi:hypothetical protein
MTLQGSSRLARFVRDAREGFAAAERDRRIITLLSTAVLPVVLAVWLGLLGVIWPLSGWLFAGVLVVLAGMQALLAWRALDRAQTLGAALAAIAEAEGEAETLRRERDTLAGERDRLDNLQTWLLAVRQFERELSKVDPSNLVGQFREAAWNVVLEEMLGPICEVQTRTIPVADGELWSVVVYVFDPTAARLRPVWWCRDPAHPSRFPSRTWAPGEGHVGLAFKADRPLYEEDATRPGVADSLQVPPDLLRSYDREAYVSFASVPFGPRGAARPRGVIAATAGRKGAFGGAANALALRHAAGFLEALDAFFHALIEAAAWPEPGAGH